ncbi:MAG TPA: riboflavin synthase [Thermoanaerobaculia bacterium]
MFTGIVKGRGRVLALVRGPRGGARLTVVPPARFGRFSRGESVCVSGVCLTALAASRRLVADLSPETLRRSTLGRLRKGQTVNLERALAWGRRLSGHFVLGHVDGVSRLLGVSNSGNSWTYRFSIPTGLARFLVEKGSVALDGISLTVAARRRASFDVAVIPETRRRTRLGEARPGDRLNLEVDLFARYGRAGWRKKLGSARRSRAR